SAPHPANAAPSVRHSEATLGGDRSILRIPSLRLSVSLSLPLWKSTERRSDGGTERKRSACQVPSLPVAAPQGQNALAARARAVQPVRLAQDPFLPTSPE